MAREWSYWTRNKLEILAGYLPAFNRASQTSRERIYLDLMAGQPENIDRDMGEKFDGSSLIAMKPIHLSRGSGFASLTRLPLNWTSPFGPAFPVTVGTALWPAIPT